MTWVDSFFSWLSMQWEAFTGAFPAPQWWHNIGVVLGQVPEEQSWMIAIWKIFESIIAMFFSLAPMAPAIFLFMSFMAVIVAVEKMSPDPIIDFVMTLYDFAIAVIGVIAAVVNMVMPL